MFGFYATEIDRTPTQSELEDSKAILFRASLLVRGLSLETYSNESRQHLKRVSEKINQIMAGLNEGLNAIVKPLNMNDVVPDGCLGLEIAGNGVDFRLRLVNRARVQSKP